MSVPASELSSPLIDAYRTHPARGRYDELVTDLGVREPATGLAATIASLGHGGLLAARSEVRNLTAAEGISYSTPESKPRHAWLVDPLPLPIAAADWSQLETGLDQRARLLDAILSDLYSHRTLLRRNIVPPAVILGHPGFARAADATVTGTGRQLRLTATDLGRDAAGNWLAISDRTQSPPGAGYAMATRRIVTKAMAGLHRRSDLARLRGFFLSTTGALLDAAVTEAETPRVVLLSPGASSPYTFDHGFLATLLGFPLAEADDLVVSSGRVWLRAGADLEPVDVILRRVDDEFCDPLEFRSHSDVGVPGLLEAVRRGTVRLANPIGTGVLDNAALIARLPAVCRELLGEELLLASPRTLWCGDPADEAEVMARFETLVIKPAARRDGGLMRYGWLLSAAERAELQARIAAEPWAWCAQEPIELSTAPVVTSSGLEPRRFVLRAFGVGTTDGYRFLPGGLGRVAASTAEHTISRATGALSKDVWVPAAAALRSPAGPSRVRLTVARETAVPPRVARTLMAIGRLAERAESTARLLKVADDLTEDFGAHPDSSGAAATIALLRAVSAITGTVRGPDESNVVYLTRVTLDPAMRGGVHHSVRRLIFEAQEVRDILSVDVWSVFNRLERTLADSGEQAAGLQQTLADVLESLLAFAGIVAQSMVRDSSWAFLDAGGCLERAAHNVKLLRHALLDGAKTQLAPSAELAAEAVLRAGESIITHRRRAAAGTGPATGTESVRQLLVHDHTNPRSVAYQLDALAADLRLVADERIAAQAAAIGAEVDSFAGVDPQRSLEQLDTLAAALSGLGERIAARHFVRQATRRTAESAWQAVP
jgi:uncharacterized circularly permuted ATP-grasp superfamily protein/uncharacterized alpha-E superfamily protein